MVYTNSDGGVKRNLPLNLEISCTLSEEINHDLYKF